MLHFAVFGHSLGAACGLGALEHTSLRNIIADAAHYHAIPTQCLSTSASHLQTLALREIGRSSRAQTWIKAVSLQ